MKNIGIVSVLFFMTIMHAGSQSSLTNHVALTTKGIHFSLSDERHSIPFSYKNEFEDKELIADRVLDLILHNTSSNYCRIESLGINKQFDFKLWDEKGREVPKTAKGKAMSKGPPSLAKFDGNRSHALGFLPGMSRDWDFPKIEELFDMHSNGDYILEIRYWLWDWIAERYRLSDPVRLKVIKQDPEKSVPVSGGQTNLQKSR